MGAREKPAGHLAQALDPEAKTSMRVYPPFANCLIHAFKTFGVIYALLLAISIAINAYRHQPLIPFLDADAPTLLVVLLVIPAVLAAAVYLSARVWAWSFDANGLRGRTYWGRRVTMRWTEVDRVANTSVQGIPALLVIGADDKREILAYTLGVDIPGIHRQLVRHAGPDHVLTRSFGPRAA